MVIIVAIVSSFEFLWALCSSALSRVSHSSRSLAIISLWVRIKSYVEMGHQAAGWSQILKSLVKECEICRTTVGYAGLCQPISVGSSPEWIAQE